jgi:hypothetical protein
VNDVQVEQNRPVSPRCFRFSVASPRPYDHIHDQRSAGSRRIERPAAFRTATSVGGRARFAGAILSIVGLVIGLNMALKRTVVHCANGIYFPEGTTDFRCFGHLHAGEGTAIAVLSVLLGIVVALLAILVSAMPASPSKTIPW